VKTRGERIVGVEYGERRKNTRRRETRKGY
jgi:hypothetical protein